METTYNNTILEREKSIKKELTVIIVNIIVAIRFECDGAIESGPAVDTDTFVFTILKGTLAMT